jgi:hypothetical protein
MPITVVPRETAAIVKALIALEFNLRSPGVAGAEIPK